MSIRNGWPAVSGAADQYDIRAALRATIAQDATGRIKTGAAATSTSLTMLVTARQDMAVDLQPSDWVLDRRGPVCLSVDGVETIHLAPAPSANSRVDTVWIMQRETQAPIGDNADGPSRASRPACPASARWHRHSRTVSWPWPTSSSPPPRRTRRAMAW